MAQSAMAVHGARLIDNGYPVLPIMPGTKVPGRFTQGEWRPYADWARHCDRATTETEVEVWQTWPDCGVGIACGAVVGIDIDLLDAELAIKVADLAQEMLGSTPCIRIGQSPKRLLVYRSELTFAGRKRHPLEVLARGQQFVAHAIHPGTGQPYAWPEDNLIDVSLDRLPMITEAQAMDWLDRAHAMVPAQLKPQSLIGEMANGAQWKGPSDPRGTYDAIAAALEFIPNEDLDGTSWITIGNAIKAALGDEGKDLWCAWSRQSTKSGASGKPNTPERRWSRLRPHSIGAGTLYSMAVDRGWVPPPEVILNAGAAEQATQPHPASGLLAKLAALQSATPPAPTPYRVPPALLEVDGALRLFIDYATSTAVSPQPFLALGAALCLIGAVAGRRYRTPTDLRSNLYAIGIADSGGGKDHARRCVKRLLFAAGLDRYLGGEDLASSTGLLSALQMHPSRLFQLDEFGQFLKLVLNPRSPFHKTAIWTEFTKLFTSAAEPYIGSEYADQKERPRKTIQQPCACVWGVTVPAPFWAALEGGALADGSLARFLVFLTDDDYPERTDNPLMIDPPAELVASLQAIAAGVPGHDHGGNIADSMDATTPIKPYTVPLAPAADAAMAAVRREATELLRSNRGTYATAMFGRYAENTAKLAMLAAISRNPAAPVTHAKDVTWAAGLVEHCIGTLLCEADRRVADNDVEARHKKMLEVIRSGKRLSRSDLVRKTQFLSRREREDILASLTESGLVIAQVEAGVTKSTTFYVATATPERAGNRRLSS